MLFGFGNEDTATESLFKSAELLVGCGNRQVRQSTSLDSISLCQYMSPNTIHSMPDSVRKTAINYIQSCHFDTVPYQSFKKIEEELSQLFKNLHDIWLNNTGVWISVETYAWMQPLADNRLQYHLNNPLTFSNKIPSLDSLMWIIYSPDGKYKFYSYNLKGLATMSGHITYFQYRNFKGNVQCQPWQNDLREDDKGVRNIWQFHFAGEDYYVIKSFKKRQSNYFSYHMEIVSIDDGEITYHTKFYPEGRYTPTKSMHLILNEYRDVIDEYWAPDYGICVCSTVLGNDIDYSFDPETLTVYATTDDETNPEKTKHESWKLILPPLNKSE